MRQTDLINLFRENREAAFRQIYEIAFPKVAALIGRGGGSLETAKDIFHEGLIILYEKCREDDLEIQGSVISYLVGICRNQWLTLLRGQDRELPAGDLSDWELAEEAEEQPSGFSLLHLLERAGKKCLDMLQAVYYFKYSMQEVAEEFGFRSQRSATVQKYKCLEKVRNEVKKHQDESILA